MPTTINHKKTRNLSGLLPQGLGTAGRNALPHKRIANNEAFTLLELLISITLITMILGILAGAMRLGYRTVQKGERRVEDIERLRATMQIIDSQLLSEIPQIADSEGTRKSYILGGKKTLQLTTNYSIWEGAKGYVLVQYRVEEDDQGKQVLYATEQYIGLSQQRRDVMLLDRCEEISFAYFDKKAEEEGKWLDEWTDEITAPDKVRVEITKGRIKWSLSVPLRVKPALFQTDLQQTLPQSQRGSGQESTPKGEQSSRTRGSTDDRSPQTLSSP